MNENIITACACGTEVIIKGAEIKATITAVCIRFGSTIYELTYYYEGNQKEVWVREQEFLKKSYEATKIGFK